MTTPKQRKRKLILESAYEIFMEEGYANTKIIDIAAHAGIGKGTIYEYFDSKESIFTALFDNFADKYKKNYETIKTQYQEDSSSEQLKAFLSFEANMTAFIGHPKKLPSGMFVQMELFKNPDLSKIFKKFMEYKFNCLLEIVKKGIDSGEFRKNEPTMSTIAILGSMSFYHHFSSNRMPANALGITQTDHWHFEDFLTLILNGLEKTDC